MITNKQLQYDWKRDIEPYLDTMQPVIGGYTPAKRGVITVADGSKVFVKISVGPMTERWVKKEIRSYQMLNQTSYSFMPKLLAYDDTFPAMAIEYLEGATFDEKWDKNKLDAVMAAQHALKPYKNLFENESEFHFEDTEVMQRWQGLVQQQSVDRINSKFVSFGIDLAFTLSQLNKLQTMHEGWTMKQDTLIHEDIRGDNFGYFADERTGKLVDWNWICVGDESLDVTSLFVDVYASGFDPYVLYPEKYDAKMLAYLVCFWLDRILVNDEHSNDREYRLRAAQAASVATCIELLGR